MPLYAFVCDDEHVTTQFAHMSDIPKVVPCSCGLSASRSYRHERKAVRTDSVPGGIFDPSAPLPKGFKVPERLKHRKDGAAADYLRRHARYDSRSAVDKRIAEINTTRSSDMQIVRTTPDDVLRSHGIDPKDNLERAKENGWIS